MVTVISPFDRLRTEDTLSMNVEETVGLMVGILYIMCCVM